LQLCHHTDLADGFDTEPGPPARDGPRPSPARQFGVGLARAVAGAILFGVPLLMTMEMWQLGFYMDRLRLALLVAATVPLLIGLSHFSGFEETFDVKQDVVDAFVACAVGFVASAAVLALFNLLRPGLSRGEFVGIVAVQAVPASIGALLAQSLLGGGTGGGNTAGDTEGSGHRRPSGYFSQLFLMAVGALFLAFNLAPTDEMVLIGYMMTPGHALALTAVSLVGMHAFVYALEFRGQEAAPPGTPPWSVFLRFTVVGYAVALVISAYVLWTFGRLDDTGWAETVTAVVVLGFPAAIGAAAARLIL
jgi:putative integral membrane protein (TIGR02587 family)